MRNLKLTLIILTLLCSFSAYALDKAKVTADGLRLRSAPNLESEIIKGLKAGEKARLIGQSDKPERIDNVDTHWYKLKLDDGTEGWAYGGYLELFAEGYESELVWEAEIPEVREGVRGKKAMPKVLVNKFAKGNVRAKGTVEEEFPFRIMGNIDHNNYRDYLLFLGENGEVIKKVDLIYDKTPNGWSSLERVKLSNNRKYVLSRIYSRSSIEIKYMDINFNVISRFIHAPMNETSSVLMSPDGEYVISVSNIIESIESQSGKLKIINNKGEIIKTFNFSTSIGARISDNGEYIFCIYGDYQKRKDFHMLIYNRKGDFIKELLFERGVFDYFSYNGETLIVYEIGLKSRHTISFYKNFELMKTTTETASYIKIAPDNKKAYGITDRNVRVYDLTTYKIIQEFPIKFSPEDRHHFIIEPESGNIIISDYNNIAIYSRNGSLLFFRSNKVTSGGFRYKKGIVFTNDGDHVKAYRVVGR